MVAACKLLYNTSVHTQIHQRTLATYTGITLALLGTLAMWSRQAGDFKSSGSDTDTCSADCGSEQVGEPQRTSDRV